MSKSIAKKEDPFIEEKKELKARYDKLRNDLFWEFVTPYPDMETIKWTGYNDANFFENVASQENWHTREDKKGNKWRLYPKTNVVENTNDPKKNLYWKVSDGIDVQGLILDTDGAFEWIKGDIEYKFSEGDAIGDYTMEPTFLTEEEFKNLPEYNF